jgi:hypothetical protein
MWEAPMETSTPCNSSESGSATDHEIVRRNWMQRELAEWAFMFLFVPAIYSLAQQVLSMPVDPPRWEFEQNAKPGEYQGRKCISINGDAAVVKNFEMRDVWNALVPRNCLSVYRRWRERRMGVSAPAQVGAPGCNAVHADALRWQQLSRGASRFFGRRANRIGSALSANL